MSKHLKVMIVVLDGLRRDAVSAAATPNLARLIADGADFPRARAVFPTVTRVNAASLSTGAPPGRHGLIANQMYVPAVRRDRVLDTPTLAGRAARAGLSVAVIGSGSGGTIRVLHPTAARHGDIALSLSALDHATPPALAAEITATLGPIPPTPGLPTRTRSRSAAAPTAACCRRNSRPSWRRAAPRSVGASRRPGSPGSSMSHRPRPLFSAFPSTVTGSAGCWPRAWRSRRPAPRRTRPVDRTARSEGYRSSVAGRRR